MTLDYAVEMSIVRLSPLPATADGGRALGFEVAKALEVEVACVAVVISRDSVRVELRHPTGITQKYHRPRLGDPVYPYPWEVRL